jgi:hypothetical protein
MRRISRIAILLASLTAVACVKTTYVPTAPGGVNGSSGNTPSGGGSGNSGTNGQPTAAAFSGVWASSTIAGLPLGTCSDVKWTITTQTATTVAGTVTASCSSGVTVAANLTGTMVDDNTINLTTNGTLTAAGIPCQFNITGTGTRQSDDSMKVAYNGTYCFGTVQGSEILRKFPNV